jgi:hypothetical protein
MMKYLIPMAIIFVLAGSALGTMWLNDDSTFFQMGTSTQSASFKPANMPVLEIIDSPFFPLLGHGFYNDPISVNLTNKTSTIQIGSKSPSAHPPVSVTFGGHLEKNLKYAQSKSSLRVSPQGSWMTLNTPGSIVKE